MYNNEMRITDSVNRALQTAGSTALQYGFYQVGTEHLLYGILSVTDTSLCRKCQYRSFYDFNWKYSGGSSCLRNLRYKGMVVLRCSTCHHSYHRFNYM